MAKQQKQFKPKARRPKGFEDRTGALLAAEDELVRVAREVFAAHGFAALATNAFEYSDALGKFLPDDDRPNAGVFSMEDEDGQWMSLRYDHTAPLARYVAENYDALAKPYRRYCAGPVWRNEKPGPGRFREFIQVDADTVGAAGAHVDAEMIMMFAEILTRVGLEPGEYQVRVNDRRLADAVLQRIGIVADETRKGITLRAMDKMDRLGADGVRLLLGEGRKDESGDFTVGAKLSDPAIDDVLAFMATGKDSRQATIAALSDLLGESDLAKPALRDMAIMDELLTAAGLGDDVVAFDPSVVRGLGYYTGPVFEAEILLDVTNAKGQVVQFGSLGGGGRYDGLVSRFRGQEVPATGFSFGVSRFAAAMQSLGRLGQNETGPVVVLVLEKDQIAEYFKMADELRQAGIVAEVYMGSSNVGKQFKYADKRNAPAVVIVGEDERQAGQVTVKDLMLGSKLSKQITDNAEWREGRPAQQSGPRKDLVKLVKSTLS